MSSTTIGNVSFIAGSTTERQAYARHYANQSIQDIDMMFVAGSIDSPAALIPTDIPGFKQVQFQQVQRSGGLSYLTPTLNSNGVLCLNGLKMKEHCCRNGTTPEIGGVGMLTVQCQTDSAAASVAAEQKYDILTIIH